MRVAIAGIHHETNTFAPVAADLAAFDAAGVVRGGAIVDELASSRATIAGFLRACAREAVDAVPLVYANLNPCGTISAEAFERLAGEIVAALDREGPFDAVLLAQHGAAVSERHPDADAELVARVRARVGPDVTVGVALDLHGNVGSRLVAACNVAVGYRENPHRDADVRGEECATLAIRAARGEIRPVQRLLRLPMVVPILGGWTGAGPMAEAMAAAERIAADAGLLSHTVFQGFGYADVADLGASVLTVADGDGRAAERAATAIGAALWDRREELRGAASAPADAVAEADRRADAAGPVVLLDVGDNVGGGAPGDSTVLLAEALARGIRGVAAPFCDERAVRAASAAGAGADVELTLGGATAASVGPPVRVRGQVAAVTDGRFEDPNPTHAGVRFYAGGPTVRVTTGDGAELVISSRPVQSISPEQLRSAGVEPREQRLIVARGVVAPRAGYEPIAASFVLADTPGVTAADLALRSYARRPRPLWPLERDVEPVEPPWP